MQKIKLPHIPDPIFRTNLQVRIYDINYGNHLGNDSLISLAHEARVRFLKHFGFTELDIDGVGILVTTLFVNYQAEAFYDDSIDIIIGIGEISRTKLDVHYDFKFANSNKIVAKVLTTITFYDYNISKVSPIPKPLLDIINSHEKVIWET